VVGAAVPFTGAATAAEIHGPVRCAGVAAIHGGQSSAGARWSCAAAGCKGDEDTRFNAALFLVLNGADDQVALDGLEGCIGVNPLHVKTSGLGGILADVAGAQRVAARIHPNVTPYFFAP